MDETSQILEKDSSIIDNGSSEKSEDRGSVPQKKIQDVCSNEGETNAGTNGIDAEELKPDYYDNVEKNLDSEPEISDKLNSTQPVDSEIAEVAEDSNVEDEQHNNKASSDNVECNDLKSDEVVDFDKLEANNGDSLSEESKSKEDEEKSQNEVSSEESQMNDVVPENEGNSDKSVENVEAATDNGCETSESEKEELKENVPSDKSESDESINGDEDRDGKNKTMETEMVSCDDIDLSQDNESQENPSLDNIAVDKRTDVFEEMDVDQVEEDKSKDVEIEEIRHPGGSEDETITGDTNNENRDNRHKDEEICIIPDDVNPRTNVDSSKKKEESDNTSEEKKTEDKESSTDVLDNKKDDESTEISKKNSSLISDVKTVEGSVSVVDENDLGSKEVSAGSSSGETIGNWWKCAQCKMVKICRFQVNQDGHKRHLCTDQCYNTFLKSTQSDESSSFEIYSRKCSQCHELVTGDEKSLSWETMDFCNEDCLGKYQTELGSRCANCKDGVPSSSMGKYCVRFGYDVKQFCTSSCLEEYKKGLKVCSYCQKDISSGTEGFLAPVGDKGQFKDFCTQSCMEKYERMSSNASTPDEIAECAVCSNSKPVKLEVEIENKTQKLCSEPCFAAFKFVNRIAEGQCDMCKKYFDRRKTENFSIYYEYSFHLFCCKTCVNVYILANRKIVPCNWCKVKKYNFDMIKKVSQGQITMVCSLNCLMLYQVSVNAVSSRHVKCDSCMTIAQAQYHLTMSDATVRNFCGYTCVMSFQNQYPKQQLGMPDADSLSSPIPTGGPKRVLPRRTQVDTACVPVISSVQSLASPNNQIAASSPRVAISTGDVNLVTPITQSITLQTAPVPAPQPPQIYQQIITKPPQPKEVKNKALLCKPYTFTKGVSCRPHPCMKETQTDESLNRKCLIPIPVPIFVPAPMHMWSSPFPVPVPFPLPVPVPIFIPTTRNSAKGIFKEIKKIQEKIPTDPFEAELLMMAEMVAGDKKQDPTDSESDEGNDADDAGDGTFSPENVDTSNTFGDDMLQMALKMATELEEPAVDMESVLTSNTITPTSQPSVDPNKSLYVADPDDPDQTPIMSMNRGRKRAIRGSRNSTGGGQSKRGRRTSGSVDVPMLPPPEPVAPPRIEVEKPDANMCLKYTFGVNAWRHWVMQKNAELEKAAVTNRKIKLFKPELLQLTADELNFSLCLFVKEVRKPNGTEYAPDTIYYLCLGIQQYLFENGRIDNIFTDSYYEKFTDCLDEVAKKFAALYNDSQYIVTRVEEEHLWESKQLGAHSPHVLLSTLMFFNTKHFNLVTVEEHMQLSFSHIMKHWKRNPNAPGVAKVPGSRNVLLRFYPPQSALEANSRKKKVYEQQENEENPLRCPVKLYEFYLSKCPESVKTRNDVFYLLPERSCVPDSPVWYSTMALGKEPLMKMLHRVKMVKEINIALLTC